VQQRHLTILLFALGGLLPRPALADPQVSVSALVGGGARRIPAAPQAAFQLGLWADLLLLRTRDADMAIGPYVHLDTLAFDTVNLGAGLSWLIPLGSPTLTLSAGAVAQHSNDWRPALQLNIFLGSRSYNFHSLYGFSLGGFLQARNSLGAPNEASLTAGLQADLAILSLPFILAYQAMRGRPPTNR
jgi:hypothetical protein